MKDRYLSLLAILGTVAVIGFHCEVRGFPAGWTAVELFFALAGARMAAAMQRDETVLAYGVRRFKRLAPEFFCVFAAGFVLLAFAPTPGLKLFLATAPVYAHNWTRYFFASTNADWLFIPLWYIGAMFQLQLLMVALRRPLGRCPGLPLFIGAMAVGMGARLLILLASGTGHGEVPFRPGEISFRLGDAIYWTPFAHVESIVAGYLVGRGSWKAIGAWLPAAVALLLIAGGINLVRWRDLPLTGFGYSLGLTHNFCVLWGYPVLAVAAASFVAPSNVISRWVNARTLAPRADAIVAVLAGCTYGVYVFHGGWIGLVKWMFAAKLGVTDASGILLFVSTLFASLASTWSFQWLYGRFPGTRAPTVQNSGLS